MITFPAPSHMPFLAPDPTRDFQTQAFCCLPVDGRWKLHILQDGEWRRMATGLPEDATECSPTAEWGEEGWRVSFIAGGAETMRVFRLCRMYGNTPAVQLCPADVGYVWKYRIVHAGRRGTLLIEDPGRTTAVIFRRVEFLYRVSYNPTRPRDLLLSGQFYGGEIFSWIYHPGEFLYRLTTDGKPAYKAALGQHGIFYADRFGEGFDDRRIVSADDIKLEPLNLEQELREERRHGGLRESEDPEFE